MNYTIEIPENFFVPDFNLVGALIMGIIIGMIVGYFMAVYHYSR